MNETSGATERSDHPTSPPTTADRRRYPPGFFVILAAQAEFLLALFDLAAVEDLEPPDPASLERARQRVREAREEYARTQRQLLAVNDPDAPLEEDAAPGEPHRCPSLPIPGPGR